MSSYNYLQVEIPISVVNSKNLGRMPMFLHSNYLSESLGIGRANELNPFL